MKNLSTMAVDNFFVLNIRGIMLGLCFFCRKRIIGTGDHLEIQIERQVEFRFLADVAVLDAPGHVAAHEITENLGAKA